MMTTITFRKVDEDGEPIGEIRFHDSPFLLNSGAFAAEEIVEALGSDNPDDDDFETVCIEIISPSEYAGFYNVEIDYTPTYDARQFEPEA